MGVFIVAGAMFLFVAGGLVWKKIWNKKMAKLKRDLKK